MRGDSLQIRLCGLVNGICIAAATALLVTLPAQTLSPFSRCGSSFSARRTPLSASAREYGNVAVLTALATYKQSGPRRDGVTSRAVITEIWVNDKGQWRLAHFQPTDVPAKPHE